MNRPPDNSKEYVLAHNHPVGYDEVLVPQDTIVVNVHLKELGELRFTVKDTGKVYSTYYGYMFAENTPENIERLQYARKKRVEYQEAKAAMEAAFKKVDKVFGPFEGYHPSWHCRNCHGAVMKGAKCRDCKCTEAEVEAKMANQKTMLKGE